MDTSYCNPSFGEANGNQGVSSWEAWQCNDHATYLYTSPVDSYTKTKNQVCFMALHTAV